MESISAKLAKFGSKSHFNQFVQSDLSPVSVGASVEDKQPDYIIENRTITQCVPLYDVVVVGDALSRKLKFAAQRYFDNVDLSSKNICVKYKNSLNKTGYTDAVVEIVKDDVFTFVWTVEDKTTAVSGKVEFAIEIYELNEDQKKKYIWNTKSALLNVEEGMIIATNDILPMDYSNQLRFYNENDNDTIYAEMQDSDEVIPIINRDILINSMRDIAVEQDTNSNIISFRTDRIFDGVDRIGKKICINFKNAKGQSDQTHIVNMKVSALEIEFGWLLDSKVTKSPGTVEFSISFIGFDEKGELYYWSTKPAQFQVEKGLFVDDVIENTEPSWLQSINSDIVRLQALKASASELSDIASELQLLQETVSELDLSQSIDGLEERFQQITDKINENKEHLASVAADVEDIGDSICSIEDDIIRIDADIENIHHNVDRVEEEIGTQIDNLVGGIDSIREVLDNSADNIDLVEHKITWLEEDVGAVRQDMEDAERSIDELEENIDLLSRRMDEIAVTPSPISPDELISQEGDNALIIGGDGKLYVPPTGTCNGHPSGELPDEITTLFDEHLANDTRHKTDLEQERISNLPVDTNHELAQKARSDDVLLKDNIVEYTPEQDYNPATKKYVDDRIAGGVSHGGYVNIDGTPLIGTTIVDISADGSAYLREDGDGDYLLHITYNGIPYLKKVREVV